MTNVMFLKLLQNFFYVFSFVSLFFSLQLLNFHKFFNIQFTIIIAHWVKIQRLFINVIKKQTKFWQVFRPLFSNALIKRFLMSTFHRSTSTYNLTLKYLAITMNKFEKHVLRKINMILSDAVFVFTISNKKKYN